MTTLLRLSLAMILAIALFAQTTATLMPSVSSPSTAPDGTVTLTLTYSGPTVNSLSWSLDAAPATVKIGWARATSSVGTALVCSGGSCTMSGTISPGSVAVAVLSFAPGSGTVPFRLHDVSATVTGPPAYVISIENSAFSVVAQ